MENPKQIPDSARVSRLEKAVKRAQYWAYGGVLAAVAVGAIGAHESGILSRRLDNALLNPNTSLTGQETAGKQPDRISRARSEDGTLRGVRGSLCGILRDLNLSGDGAIEVKKRETNEVLVCAFPKKEAESITISTQ
jgi:hypothetical protein